MLSLTVLSSLIYVDRGVFASESRHESIVPWPEVNSSSQSDLQVHLWRVGVRNRLHQALLSLKIHHWHWLPPFQSSLPKMEVNLETIDRGECSDAHQKSSFTEALDELQGLPLGVNGVCVCVSVCVCLCVCVCKTGMSVQGHPTMHRSVPHNMESTWLTLFCHLKGWLMDKSVIFDSRHPHPP